MADRASMSAGRGHLRVFLGMAAGVGKTFRMLLDGHAEQEAGRDVVIGLLETHGRADTAKLAEGLPILPRRRVEYRGTKLEEMDLTGDPAARSGAVPDRRARTHQRARSRASEAIRGRRGRTGGRE